MKRIKEWKQGNKQKISNWWVDYVSEDLCLSETSIAIPRWQHYP